jgi:hypothetical protein
MSYLSLAPRYCRFNTLLRLRLLRPPRLPYPFISNGITSYNSLRAIFVPTRELL